LVELEFIPNGIGSKIVISSEDAGEVMTVVASPLKSIKGRKDSITLKINLGAKDLKELPVLALFIL